MEPQDERAEIRQPAYGRLGIAQARAERHDFAAFKWKVIAARQSQVHLFTLELNALIDKPMGRFARS